MKHSWVGHAIWIKSLVMDTQDGDFFPLTFFSV